MSRIGDYDLARSLPATQPGVLEYEGTHVVLPRHARLRVVAAGDARRLMREACILEALRRPGVPRVYECGLLPDRRPWIAVEMLEGPTLADALADRPATPREVLALLRDVAQILHHAHGRGVVHTRLRPSLVVRDTAGLYVTGWADARTHDAEPPLADTDHTSYDAPELVRGEAFGPEADIYSLGVIAYEALARSAPTLPLARRVPGLPRALAVLIERMLATAAAARPTAAEVRAEADRLLELEEPQDDIEVEIDLDLEHDISRDPPPLPRAVRWTPPYVHAPTLAGELRDLLPAPRRR